jgi:hypothetical protein
MPIAFYMDEHVDFAITTGLRRRGVDVLAVHDDGYNHTNDIVILDHAMTLGRVMVTQDTDFLVEAYRRQTTGEQFAGVVFFHQNGLPVGRVIAELELIALAGNPPDLANKVEFLPL